MGYSFLEHRSDIIILGKNVSFESALVDVAAGMFSQMGAEHAKEKESFELEFVAPTKEQLVVQLLTEIIAECETRPFTPKRMEVFRFDHAKLSIAIRVYGENKVSENIIKAVTYHELRIEKKIDEKAGKEIGKNAGTEAASWEIQVLFDI